MKRALTVASHAALALLAATMAALWVRSYRSGDFVNWTTIYAGGAHMADTEIGSWQGSLFVYRTWGETEDGERFTVAPDLQYSDVTDAFMPRDLARDKHRRLLGFEWTRTLHDGISSTITARVVGIPHWLVLLGLISPAAAKARRMWHIRRRLATGCCTACGYDLRASTDRCPECGTPVLAKPAPSGSSE